MEEEEEEGQQMKKRVLAHMSPTTTTTVTIPTPLMTLTTLPSMAPHHTKPTSNTLTPTTLTYQQSKKQISNYCVIWVLTLVQLVKGYADFSNWF